MSLFAPKLHSVAHQMEDRWEGGVDAWDIYRIEGDKLISEEHIDSGISKTVDKTIYRIDVDAYNTIKNKVNSLRGF